MTRWVALLRGINVGGSNQLAMADLRATMERLGFENVATYIQSGNVIFDAAGTAPAADEARTARRIADGIVEQHGLNVPVVVRPADDLRRVATSHPDIESGIDPKLLHVVFLDEAPSPDRVAGLDPARYEPDAWAVIGREVFVRYPNGSGRSKLTIDVFERAFGCTATARNLNTVRKLVELAS